MKAKELNNIGIDRERIKYYKKKGVFTQEVPAKKNKADYSEKDVLALKQLTILTKAGLSCGDIQRIQSGNVSLHDALIECQAKIQQELQQRIASLQLGTELLSDHADYADMSIEHYWAEITAKEQQGEEYMDYYDDPGLDFFRTITCPYCGKTQKVDLEEFIYDEVSNPSTRDDDMGPDIVHYFDSTDGYNCECCGKLIQIKGWIREYPIGGYDSEEVNIYKGFIE